MDFSIRLIPASGNQDHTAWPYATRRTSCAATRPSQPPSRLVTNGHHVPHVEAGWRNIYATFRFSERHIFCEGGWTLPVISERPKCFARRVATATPLRSFGSHGCQVCGEASCSTSFLSTAFAASLSSWRHSCPRR